MEGRLFNCISKQRLAFAMLLIIAFLIVFAHCYKPDFAVSDQFERARVAEEAVRAEKFPESNNIYGTELKHIYPPLFDVQSAVAKTFSGLGYALQWRLLSYALLFLVFFYSFRLAALYLEKNFALVAAFLASMLPWVFRRIAFPIPESAGLALFVVLLYYLLKKNFFVLALLMPVLALYHVRSFATFFALFALLGGYFLIRKETTPRRLILPVVAVLALAGWWLFHYLASSPLVEFSNPWVYVVPAAEMFSVLWPFALLSVLVLALLGKWSLFVWFFSAGLLVAIFSGSTVGGFRELVYLFFPVAFLSASVLLLVRERMNYTASLFLFAVLVLGLLSANIAWIRQESYFSAQNLSAVKALDNFAGSIVLSDFGLSYAVPYYTGKRVVIGAFMEQLPDSAARAWGSLHFFMACSSREFLWARDVELLHLTPYASEGLGCSAANFPDFDMVFDSGRNRIVRVVQR